MKHWSICQDCQEIQCECNPEFESPEWWLNRLQEHINEKIHALNSFNIDQAFTITKRELLEKLK